MSSELAASSRYTFESVSSKLDVDGAPPRSGASARRTINFADLPWLLRLSIRFSAVRFPVSYLFFCSLCGGGLGTFVVVTYMTDSLAIGCIVGSVFACGGISYVLMPDFGKGIFLDMLLNDETRLKKIIKGTQSSVVLNTVFFDFVVVPIMTYFIIVPMTQTDLMGPHTRTLTIVMWTFACSTLISGPFFDTGAMLVNEVSQVWEEKIQNYLRHIRTILLEEEDEGLAKDSKDLDRSDARKLELTKRVSQAYVEADLWAREVTKGTATTNSFILAFSIFTMLLMLSLAASDVNKGKRVSTIVVTSLMALSMLLWSCGTMLAVAKPNVAWEKNKNIFLNDPLVQRAIVNIGWEVRWDTWMAQHELNAARIFGVKLTSSRMRQVSSVLASGFTVVMYFLLREELRGLL